MHLDGVGVEKNSQRALIRFKDIADQGCKRAQYMTGLMYEHGEGEAKNINYALYYYKMANKNGDQDASIKVDYLKELSSSSDDYF